MDTKAEGPRVTRSRSLGGALFRAIGILLVSGGAFEFAWAFTQGWSNAAGQAAAYSDQSIWLAEATGGYLVGVGLVLVSVGVILAELSKKS